MKKLMLAFGLCALATSTAAVAGTQDFKLVNRTGATIEQVYVSPSKADNWEEDVMGADTLADDASVNIRFSDETSNCEYDLKVVFDDGDEAQWSGFDLCVVSKIALSFDKDGDPWADTE